MSSSLRSFYCTLRAVLFAVAPVLFAGQAMAGSSTAWAPMCDPSAASVVAPLIAPPVEAGEIADCPDGIVWEDFAQTSLQQGTAPGGEPEPGLQLDAPSPRVLPAAVYVAPRLVRAGEVVVWPDVRVGPAVAFERMPDRPPCA